MFILASSDSGRTEHAVGRAGADDSDDIEAAPTGHTPDEIASSSTNGGGVKVAPLGGSTSAGLLGKAGGGKGTGGGVGGRTKS